MPKGKSSTSRSPMMAQFDELKAQVPDALLLFRLGDFYELFGDDATLVAPILGIVLTSREKNTSEQVPFCGIPHHSYAHHLIKLLRLGYKVAIAEQCGAGNAGAGGLMRRQIVRIHTLACTDEMMATEQGETHYLMAIYECPETRQWVYVLADYALGELRLAWVRSLDDVAKMMALYQPTEVLVRRFQRALFEPLMSQCHLAHSRLVDLPEGGEAYEACDVAGADEELSPSWRQAYARIRPSIQDVLAEGERTASDRGSLSQIGASAQVLIAATMRYFGELKASCQHFRKLTAMRERPAMALSEVAVRDLELFRAQRTGGVKGSLWSVIHGCMTPMGSRELKARLLHPYRDRAVIQRSHRLIELLLSCPDRRWEAWRSSLRQMADAQRLTQRLAQGKLRPAEALLLKRALGQIRTVADEVARCKATLPTSAGGEYDHGAEGEDRHGHERTYLKQVEAALRGSSGAGDVLDDALADDTQQGEVSWFRHGYDEELDKLQEWSRQGDQKLRDYEDELRQDLGISSVKIKNHKTYGYLIEITKAHLHKLEALAAAESSPVHELELKQTMVGSQRYTTARLRHYTELIMSSQSQASAREQELYSELLERLGGYHDVLLQAGAAVATWDLALTMAWMAAQYGWCQPQISTGGELELEDAFHPVVAHHLPTHQYTTNSIRMSREQRCLLITGPNMGGKSTLMRQVALVAVLNQIGAYVPAQRAKLPIFDGVYTRVGASDHLAAGQSTFMVEMMETAMILRHATASSLVILDELGRGTSTEDGMALAWSFLKEFASELKSWVLFATHYHELAHKANKLEGVRLMQTEVVRLQGKLHFSYRLIPGVCSHSFGLETARLAGISEHILAEATQSLRAAAPGDATATSSASLSPPPPPSLSSASSSTSPAASGAVLASEQASPAVWLGKELEAVDPLRMSPLEALQVLSRWHARLKHGPDLPSLGAAPVMDKQQSPL